LSRRAFFVASLALIVVAAAIAPVARRSARAAAFHGADLARLDALLAARLALETSVLEARAGLQSRFDLIDRAVLVLRTAADAAGVVRGRGSDYAEAADELVRTSQALHSEEAALETFKSDLALLRLSSRYLPLAAAALLQRAAGVRTPDAHEATRSALAARIEVIDELRTNVERYQETPTREIAQRIEAIVPVLGSLRATLDDDAQADLDVMLGHARVILDRRERVDRFTRNLVHSPTRAHVEAARAAYERAALRQAGTNVALRIAASEIGALGIIALGAAAWLGGRRPPRATDFAVR